jgi:hypothetical protein
MSISQTMPRKMAYTTVVTLEERRNMADVMSECSSS